jgi:beta-xylosidase
MKLLNIKYIAVALMFLAQLNGLSQSPSFKTYTNPVIPGDHSDCTLTKVGKDYYSTGSSFNPTPVIYHSTDLIHWEAIAQPVSAAWTKYGDRPAGGCWGGQIVFYNNKWWDFFGVNFAMYFTKADKPEGPWSTPVAMKVPSTVPGFGADNSIFIDDDSSWYLLVKNGQENNWIVQLGNDGQPAGSIYDLRWLNPAPGYPYSWAEGPVMWKHNGYYYYSFARDVSGGQKVMRSSKLTGEKSAWSTPVDFFNENDPDKSKAIFSGPNHSSAAVLIDDSTSWVIHPVWSRANGNEWNGQGRQGLVNQVRYNSTNNVVADYPANKSFTAPKLPSSGIPWMVPHSDFFSSAKLNPEWSFLGYTPLNLWSLTERPGWLRLRPKSATKTNTVIKTDAEHNYSLITLVDFKPKSTSDEAGIRIISGNENSFIKIYSSVNSLSNKVICLSFGTNYYESENTIGDVVWLKLLRTNHKIKGYFSADGNAWTQIGKEIDVAVFDKEQANYNGWCGNRQGLYVAGTYADFDLYIYRDAYSLIMAESPTNQLGTTKSLPIQSVSMLDNIHNNDWVLYAGVEFGNDNLNWAPDSVELTASSISAGGTVQVWLDSIDSGIKVAECPIGNTGSLSVFKKFKAPVTPVSGNHDLYLKFLGAGSNNLFQLRWISFGKKQPPTNTASTVRDLGKLSVFPNPAKNQFTIQSDFLFNKAEIFDMKGQRVFLNQTAKTENLTLNFDLPAGLYLLKISSDKQTASSKLVIN